MFKHVIGQALFQIAMLVFLVFAGENLLKEFEDGFDKVDEFEASWKYGVNGMARSGRLIKINGEADYQ